MPFFTLQSSALPTELFFFVFLAFRRAKCNALRQERMIITTGGNTISFPALENKHRNGENANAPHRDLKSENTCKTNSKTTNEERKQLGAQGYEIKRPKYEIKNCKIERLSSATRKGVALRCQERKHGRKRQEKGRKVRALQPIKATELTVRQA